MNRKQKLYTLITLVLSMVLYIAWVFYQSEPKYIDNSNHTIERYDYVSIPEDYGRNGEVINGIVLQVDDSFALVLVKSYKDEFYELDIKKSSYRIVGKGTIYHKINSYVGFNIMLITQVFMAFLLIITGFTLATSFKEFLTEKK
jgi:hypothetical protein